MTKSTATARSKPAAPAKKSPPSRAPKTPRPSREDGAAKPASAPVVVTIPLGSIVEASWNYKEPGTDAQMAKIMASIEEDQSAGILAVREIGPGQYEAIDGNHRLVALRKLGRTEAVCENFGKLPLARAVLVARRRNHQWFEDNIEKLGALFKDHVLPSFSVDDLAKFMPDSAKAIQSFVDMADFDWSSLPATPKSVEHPKLGVVMTPEVTKLVDKWREIARSVYGADENTDLMCVAMLLAIEAAGSLHASASNQPPGKAAKWKRSNLADLYKKHKFAVTTTATAKKSPPSGDAPDDHDD